MPAANDRDRVPVSAETLSRLACPACYGTLALDSGGIRCVQCGRSYPVYDGIPVLIAERATRVMAE